MRKLDKPSPRESPLLFAIDLAPERLTALGGIPLLEQAFRSLGLPASVHHHVRVKERQRGYDEVTMVESFVVLNAAGGECLEDFGHLREDGGLAELPGHEIVHDVLKNELAAGVLPCGRFGANAAWLRMAVRAHNVMTALK
jgi:hypothetical protein